MRETTKYFLKRFLIGVSPFFFFFACVSLSLGFRQDFLLIVTVIVDAVALAFGLYFLAGLISAVRCGRRWDDKICNDQMKRGLMVEGGAPRAGKTLDATATLISHAAGMWAEICEQKAVWEKGLDELDGKERERIEVDYKEILSTYNLYNDNPQFIPCLLSNTYIEDEYGRTAGKISPNQIRQLDRIPYRCDILIDESSYIVDPDIHKESGKDAVKLDIDECARFVNQYFGENNLFILCEQDPKKPYIGFRRCASRNKYQLGKVDLCRPVFLIKRYQKALKKYLKDEKRQTPQNALKLIQKKKHISKIGYMRLSYVEDGNVENNYLQNREIECEYIPFDSGFYYNSRAFRMLYKCRSKPLTLTEFESEFVNPQIRNQVIRYIKSDSR